MQIDVYDRKTNSIIQRTYYRLLRAPQGVPAQEHRLPCGPSGRVDDEFLPKYESLKEEHWIDKGVILETPSIPCCPCGSQEALGKCKRCVTSPCCSAS